MEEDFSSGEGQPVDLSKLVIRVDALEAVPQQVAIKYTCFPVAVEEDTIHLALADPLSEELRTELEELLGKKVVLRYAPKEEIKRRIYMHYMQRGFA